MKILVVKPTALGDVAQALLLAPPLRRWRGCTRLDWVVDEDYSLLVEASPAVDVAVPFPRRRWRRGGCVREMVSWAGKLRRERYDAVLDLQGLARSGLMTLASGAPRRIGLASAREGARWACNELVRDDAVHAVDRYAQAVAHLTGEPAVPEPMVHHPSDLPAGLRPGEYTVIHAYSQWPAKQWPWEKVGHLAQRLPVETFALVGKGPFFPVLAPNVVDLRNRTDLRQLADVLSGARVVVSTDSGPAHVAALLGTPVLALFGPTSPAKTAPRHPDTRVLTGEHPPGGDKPFSYKKGESGVGLGRLSVEKVAMEWLEMSMNRPSGSADSKH